MNQYQILFSVLKEFSMMNSSFTWSTVTAGLINDTFLIRYENGTQFILQKINQQVFKEVTILMKNVQNALPFLKAKDYTELCFLPSQSGNIYLEKDQSVWRIMTYIEDSTTYNTTTSLVHSFEAGRIIGRFHSLLQSADGSLFKDSIPNFHDVPTRQQEFYLALKNATEQKRKSAVVAIEKAHFFIKKIACKRLPNLPIRVCHNDTKLNNILFSKTSKKALCLIDLDTLMNGYFYYDFGDAIRTIVTTAPEDEKDLSKIGFDTHLFTAFVDGLATNPSFLSKHEKDSLSLGAVIMPFLHGLRAVTDFLNNDIYYKVDYKNQNLDRSLSLFCFAEKAWQQQDLMTSYIQKKLS